MPGFVQPQPGCPASFLSAVSACTYDGTASALRDAAGALRYVVLVQSPAGGASADWGVDASTSACPRSTLSSSTFDVLTLGVLQTNGTFLLRGSYYRVIAAGPTLACSAVPA